MGIGKHFVTFPRSYLHRGLRRILTVMGVLGIGLAASEWFPINVSSAKAPLSDRAQYEISLVLDFDNRTYTGTETVRWVNQGEHSASVLYFHLYSNLRADAVSQLEPDEPRLEITGVRSAETNLPLAYSLEDQSATLRINLGTTVPKGQSIAVLLTFKGSVPEIDADETGLSAHIVKQVSATIRGEKEIRRARDINFRSKGVMLLGTAYPVLAVHDGDEWRRKVEPSIGDIIFNEAADYQVSIEAGEGVNVFTPGIESEPRSDASVKVAGTALRDFVVLAGRSLRTEETTVNGITLRSVFLPDHERVGRRALRVATNAIEIFRSNFGPVPFQKITIAEVPLVAGLGSNEFSGFNVVASAFYVDFDSPAMRNLPEIIREQRPAVEQSLEWTIAHLLAHQWWGLAVGNDPFREPVLDEALSCWSALLYYQEVYGGEQATAVREDQLEGVYRLYRTFGGDDMTADRPSRDYRNGFQYTAIVTTKGALMFLELQRLLGGQKFFAALGKYYQTNLFEIAELDDLRGALIAEAPLEQRRAVARIMNRWLSSKRGDEDIAKPDQELATSLGLESKPPAQKSDRNALTAFARLGKFFWQQMTRIR